MLAALGLGLATAGAIGHGSVGSRAALLAGIVVLVAFVLHERRVANPMLPLRLFSSAQFSGANAVTLAVYAGLGVATFLVVLQLQLGLGYSALQAGAALLPVTLMLLVLSSPMGALAQRIGPTGPMTVGPLVAGLGLLALSTVEPGDAYVPKVLVAVSVLGLGLAVTVAPLTAVVMASVDELHLGVASGVNNAVARMASLIGVAVVPTLAGVDLTPEAGSGLPGYRTALVIAAVPVRRRRRHRRPHHPSGPGGASDRPGRPARAVPRPVPRRPPRRLTPRRLTHSRTIAGRRTTISDHHLRTGPRTGSGVVATVVTDSRLSRPRCWSVGFRWVRLGDVRSSPMDLDDDRGRPRRSARSSTRYDCPQSPPSSCGPG